MSKHFLVTCLFLFTTLLVQAQNDKSRWIDSVYQSMTLSERIAQLFVLPIDETSSEDIIREGLKSNNVGAILISHSTPTRMVNLLNDLRERKRVMPLIIVDAEWGPASSLDSTLAYPKPALLGAANNLELTKTLAFDIGTQLKMLGADLAIIPSASRMTSATDLRSSGVNPTQVTNQALAWMEGLKMAGVSPFIRYFVDSNVNLEGIKNGVPETDIVIADPNKQIHLNLFKAGLQFIMAEQGIGKSSYGHQGLQKRYKFNPKALSSVFIAESFRRQLNYEGLLMADVRNLIESGVKTKSGEAEVFAYRAGNNLLYGSENISAAIRKLRQVVRRDGTSLLQFEQSVKLLLGLKYENRKPYIPKTNLVAKLTTPHWVLHRDQAYYEAVTVLAGRDIPVRHLENHAPIYINGTSRYDEKLVESLNRYTNHRIVNYKANWSAANTIVVGLFPDTPPPVALELATSLRAYDSAKFIFICDFGYPNFYKEFGDFRNRITGYVRDEAMINALPQILYGARGTQARQPYSDTGVKVAATGRLAYGIPEEAEMSSEVLQRVDSIAREAIAKKATPGCQVLIARRGKVIYSKSFGTLIYESNQPVTASTLYDLASLTKVSATLQAVMFLYDRGMFDLHRKISYYLPELRNSNKKDLTLIDILTHQSGLQPFLPMWPETMQETTAPIYYRPVQSEDYPYQVGANLFATKAMPDSVWNWIVKSKLLEKPPRTPYPYRYSDLGFMMLKRLCERLLNQPIDEFLHQNLYEPLGANTLGFNPLQHFETSRIAPTENDLLYRKQVVQGIVHDERAAMLGGVSGHAGLFGTATDLSKLGQMLVQGGSYGGDSFYKPTNVTYFGTRTFKTSRRGLGWDKPLPGDPASPVSAYASPETFGHTGFTGTCMWIDPAFDLVYIFLSNRVYPDRSPKLGNENIRTRIQDAAYQSIFRYAKP